MGMPGLSPFWETSVSTLPDISKVQPVRASTAPALSSDIAATVKQLTRKEAASNRAVWSGRDHLCGLSFHLSRRFQRHTQMSSESFHQQALQPSHCLPGLTGPSLLNVLDAETDRQIWHLPAAIVER